MIRSMTGYGKATAELASKRITIEIRSVNSKQLDLNLKTPNIYREKELELRSLLSKHLDRGKVDLMLSIDNNTGQVNFTLDMALAENYYRELKALSDRLSLGNTDYLAVLSRMPEVIKQECEKVDEDEWSLIFTAVEEAIRLLDEFRIHEGEVISKDFAGRINFIELKLNEVGSFEQQRISALKDRIRKNLREFSESENYDENRFEQELFYYIEKLDITEEKTRLKKHLDFFQQTLTAEGANGKKLSFISQEIGREINTLGSKANDADIQKLVVEMKDELEKVKEQLLNIL